MKTYKFKYTVEVKTEARDDADARKKFRELVIEDLEKNYGTDDYEASDKNSIFKRRRLL